MYFIFGFRLTERLAENFLNTTIYCLFALVDFLFKVFFTL